MPEISPDSLCHIVVIENERGLHARAAARFVRVAESFQSDISVVRDELRVSGRSIMGLMMLAATCGTRLTLCACGVDASEALNDLAELVKRGFDEAE